MKKDVGKNTLSEVKDLIRLLLPGHRHSQDALEREILILVICVYAIGIVIGVALGVGPSLLSGLLALLMTLGIIRFVMEPSGDSLVNRIKGFKGEYKVSTILGLLWDKGYRHVDDLMIEEGHGNVDHVVVGPGGVWAIETKHMNGHITAEGDRLLRDGRPFSKDPLSQAYAAAKSIERYLRENGFFGVVVRPVLVFSGQYAKVRFGEKEIRRVQVVGTQWIEKIIVSHGEGAPIPRSTIDAMIERLRLKQFGE